MSGRALLVGPHLEAMAKFCRERGMEVVWIDRELTLAELEQQARTLIQAAKPGDNVLMHYQGKGAQLKLEYKEGSPNA